MNMLLTSLLLVAALAVSGPKPTIAGPVEPQEADFDFADFGDDISKMALFESDDIETEGLKDEMLLFGDFCINTRDRVQQFAKNSANDAIMKLFNIMFNSADDDFDTEAAPKLDNISEQAIAETTELIKSSDLEQHQPPANMDELDKQIEENVDKVQEASLWSTVTEAVQVVVNTAISTIRSRIGKRIVMLKEAFNTVEARRQLGAACNAITKTLQNEIDADLVQAKKELVDPKKRDPNEKEYVTRIRAIRLKDINCVTIKRMSVISRFCDVMNVVAPVVFEMFKANSAVTV